MAQDLLRNNSNINITPKFQSWYKFLPTNDEKQYLNIFLKFPVRAMFCQITSEKDYISVSDAYLAIKRFFPCFLDLFIKVVKLEAQTEWNISGRKGGSKWLLSAPCNLCKSQV